MSRATIFFLAITQSVDPSINHCVNGVFVQFCFRSPFTNLDRILQIDACADAVVVNIHTQFNCILQLVKQPTLFFQTTQLRMHAMRFCVSVCDCPMYLYINATTSTYCIIIMTSHEEGMSLKSTKQRSNTSFCINVQLGQPTAYDTTTTPKQKHKTKTKTKTNTNTNIAYL